VSGVPHGQVRLGGCHGRLGVFLLCFVLQIKKPGYGHRRQDAQKDKHGDDFNEGKTFLVASLFQHNVSPLWCYGAFAPFLVIAGSLFTAGGEFVSCPDPLLLYLLLFYFIFLFWVHFCFIFRKHHAIRTCITALAKKFNVCNNRMLDADIHICAACHNLSAVKNTTLCVV